MSVEILVVDDSSVMRAMIIRTLRMVDLPLGEIHQAANGREGLDLLAAHPVDLVMVDINMPVMGGEEMIERMRAEPELAALPVLVVSTESSETRISELAEKGVHFVHKPFSPEVVRDALRGALESLDA